MTKLSVFSLVTALTVCYMSSLTAQVQFGLKAGYNHASMPLSDDYIAVLEFVENADFENKSLPAFHAGMVLDIGFGGNFGLGTGLEFSVKGGEHVFTDVVFNVPYTRTKSIKPMYLQVPLLLTFRNSGFCAGVGPYFGLAVAGKVKTKIKYGGDSSEESENIDFGSELGKDFGKTDYGVAFELGYDFFSNLRLSGSYQLGLANVLPSDEVKTAEDHNGDWRARNNVIGISLTYLFGRVE